MQKRPDESVYDEPMPLSAPIPVNVFEISTLRRVATSPVYGAEETTQENPLFLRVATSPVYGPAGLTMRENPRYYFDDEGSADDGDIQVAWRERTAPGKPMQLYPEYPFNGDDMSDFSESTDFSDADVSTTEA